MFSGKEDRQGRWKQLAKSNARFKGVQLGRVSMCGSSLKSNKPTYCQTTFVETASSRCAKQGGGDDSSGCLQRASLTNILTVYPSTEKQKEMKSVDDLDDEAVPVQE